MATFFVPAYFCGYKLESVNCSCRVLDFLKVVGFRPLTWQPALQGIGLGGPAPIPSSPTPDDAAVLRCRICFKRVVSPPGSPCSTGYQAAPCRESYPKTPTFVDASARLPQTCLASSVLRLGSLRK